MQKKGILHKAARGIYSASEEVFAVASNIHYPSYVSFLSASYLYGFTETIPRIVSIAAAKKYSKIEFKGYTIEFVRMKELWGYKNENGVFLAEPEKLLIDAFLKPKSMGNFEEIERLFGGSLEINAEKLKTYLKKTNSDRVYRCVGYMLEKHRKIDISRLMRIDRNYYELNPFESGAGINRKWRLKV
ncbi:hypothetical protein AUJ17_05460 [Candidatus Micrarchaeota archaeon CG1_02_47_40]|nr:MAG: hypothetical protein AUJ17_05460 [Candidatus Micrarchaeota archaeon CG1_02_47_40]